MDDSELAFVHGMSFAQLMSANQDLTLFYSLLVESESDIHREIFFTKLDGIIMTLAHANVEDADIPVPYREMKGVLKPNKSTIAEYRSYRSKNDYRFPDESMEELLQESFRGILEE